jgi:hypothetical protein
MDSWGKIDNDINTNVYFKFRLFTNDERKKLGRGGNDFYIMANIEKLEFYTPINYRIKDVNTDKSKKIGEMIVKK